MKKLILLLSLTLTACMTKIEPEGWELPSAKVGQPYHQFIRLSGSIPRTIWVGIGPENNGLSYRFLYSNPNKKVITNRGDIIEISGIPNDNDDSEITIFVGGYGYQGMQDGKKRFQKIYTIKLIPDKNHPRKPAKKPDVPNCTVAYDDGEHQLCI